MRKFTMQDLRKNLEAAAGEVDGVDWDSPGTLDLSFEDIGYDSLALHELSSLIEREYGVRIPGQAIEDEMQTPGQTLDYFNKRLAEV